MARLFLEFLVSEETQNLGNIIHLRIPMQRPQLEEMDVTGKVLVTQSEEQLANQLEYTEKMTDIFVDK